MAKPNPNIDTLVKLPFSYKTHGTIYPAGRPVPVTRREAEILKSQYRNVQILDASKVEAVRGTGGKAVRVQDAGAPASGGAVADAADAGEARQQAIMEAIERLQRAGGPSHFTASGTPQVKAIEAVLGYDITAGERDAAWARLRSGADAAASGA